MPKLLTMITLCVIAVSTLAPCLWAEPAQAPPSTVTFMQKSIPLQHLSVKELRLELLSQQSPLPPTGIFSVTCGAKSDIVVASAKDPQALELFETLVKHFDTLLDPGKAKSLLPAPDGAVKPVVRKVDLHHISADELCTVLEGMKPFAADGVLVLVGLHGLNSLVVRARDEESIDNFTQLIALLDRPVKSALVEAIFAQVDAKALDELRLLPTVQKQGEPASMMIIDSAQVKKWLATSNAMVLAVPRLVVANGGIGSATIEEDAATSFGLTVNRVAIQPDDAVKLRLTFRLSLPTPQDGKPTTNEQAKASAREINKSFELHMKGGITGMLMLDPAEENAAKPGTIVTLAFVTVTIVEDDATDVNGMRKVPALF